jgi:hypothetical protein
MKQIYIQDRSFHPAVVMAASLPADAIFAQDTPERIYYPELGNWHAGTVVVPYRQDQFVFNEDDIIASAFDKLRAEWHTERGATSSITEMVMCQAHLKIIAMGPRAVPLILRRMEDEGAQPDMWFVALQMLTSADPVTDEIRGDFPAMARRWLDWAAAHGYAW